MSTLQQFRDRMKDTTDLPRRRISITIPASECIDSPKDLSITLRSLSSYDEMEAANQGGNNPLSIMMAQLKMAIESIDGEVLKEAEGDRNIVWEYVLGQTGRNFLLKYYSQLVQPDEEQVKKAELTFRVL